VADKNDIVIIELDRPRMLWFGHKALKTLTALTGKKLEDFETAFQDMDFELLEKVLYCGLLTDAKANNEVLKLEEMEDLLDKAPFKLLTQKMQQAFIAAFGGEEKNA
jgi:hypothetical protein